MMLRLVALAIPTLALATLVAAPRPVDDSTTPLGAERVAAPAASQAATDSATDGRFTMALTGDSIITRRLSVYQEPTFLDMIEIIRGADVAFTNLEMLFHNYEPYPMHQSGGTYMRAAPALVNELVWAGFDVVARANNHTGDYGTLGMELTTKYVAEAGLVQAGVGAGLTQAREAKFLETAEGRVALISMASTFPDHARAGRTRGRRAAAPGPQPAALFDDLRRDTRAPRIPARYDVGARPHGAR